MWHYMKRRRIEKNIKELEDKLSHNWHGTQYWVGEERKELKQRLKCFKITLDILGG